MLLTLAHIGTQKSGKPGNSNPKANFDVLTRLYLDRLSPYFPCQSEAFSTEAALLARFNWPHRQQPSGKSPRTPAVPILLDSRGRQLSSPDLAAWIGARRDQGAQHLIFAIGPPDGWSATALDLPQAQNGLQLSFGLMTLPHEMARLVLAEQLYRAATILANHPYHSGH